MSEPPNPTPITPVGLGLNRRQGLALGGLAVAGLGLSWLLSESAPLGEDVGDHPAARDVLADRTAPRLTLAGGTLPDLTIAVFTDYRCPACRTAYLPLFAAAKADGRVALRIFDWPIFGAPSRRLAQAALGAGFQGKYGLLHHRLMTEPPPGDDDGLAAMARGVGLNWSTLSADLTTHAAAIHARLTRTAAQAFALGLPGTPAYLIGATLMVGALNERAFARAIATGRRS